MNMAKNRWRGFMSGFITLIPTCVLFWLGAFLDVGERRRMYFIESRKKVNEQFLKLGIDEEDQQYALKGSTATIVQDQESEGQGETSAIPEYHLTRFARNTYGEYFMLMYTVIGGEVSMLLCRHISQTNARIALKKQYVPQKTS